MPAKGRVPPPNWQPDPSWPPPQAGKGRGYWYHDDVRMGTLICLPRGSGFQIPWTFEGRNVVAIADGADAATAYAWWQDNANLLAAA